MDWVEEFYSVTGRWWGAAEGAIGPADRMRADHVSIVAPAAARVLELGCGYGSTAIAMAQSGFAVTGVELSDRLDHVPPINVEAARRVELLRADFYDVDLAPGFDVVCYWDGFGVGTDHDQRRLLRRIADLWLAEVGVAIIEVFNPVAWAASSGLGEVKEPDPSRGYHHRLGHRRSYDPNGRIAFDTWWEIGSDREWTQSLRCYSPDELTEVLDGTGLEIERLTTLSSPDEPAVGLDAECFSYIAHLRHQRHAKAAGNPAGARDERRDHADVNSAACQRQGRRVASPA